MRELTLELKIIKYKVDKNIKKNCIITGLK